MKHIFIDESGIHKKDGRSSVVLVYVHVDDMGECNRAVIDIEQRLGISVFKWSHAAWEVRKKFVRSLKSLRFSLKVAILSNPFQEDVDYIRTLKHFITDVDIGSIIIDGKKSSSYGRKIKRALSVRGISVRKLKTASDEGYPMLRIADACAGIFRYYADNPTDKRIIPLHRAISRKIQEILEN